MTLKVDRDTLLHLALSETTGGQSETHLSWRFQARVFLYAGLHQLSLCRADDMPNVRTIAILPVRRPAAQDSADVLSTDDHAGAARTEARSAWGKGLRRQVPERVLVCVLAQTRAYQFTWRNFKRHVLDELEADLAVCIGVDDHYDYANPFWQHARYRWTGPEYDDFGDGFDIAQHHLAGGKLPISFNWRDILQIKDQWLGGIKGQEAHPGSAGILIYFRWLLLHNLMSDGLLHKYDRFIITRSDFLWTCPHPPLSTLPPTEIWFPDGEGYGGLTDRHHVVSSQDLPYVINLIDDVVLRPDDLMTRMAPRGDWNLESYIYFHLEQQDLLGRTRVFPQVMFSVRGQQDSTRWAAGKWDEDLGVFVKYESELVSARLYEGRIRTRRDWERLYAEGSSHFRLCPQPV